MVDYRGALGLLLLLGIAVLFSRDRRGIAWRTVLAALAVQVVVALAVLRFAPGEAAMRWLSARVETLIGYTDEGTSFVFGPLLDVGGEGSSIFALQVLPVIIFLGAIVQLLFYLRVIQYVTHYLGGAIGWLLKVTKVESLYASTVIFLGQSEAPLMISPYLRTLSHAQVFTVMSAGFAAAAGSTLVGYALLGAPLEYLLAATVMNAPAALMMAKIMWPDSAPDLELAAGSAPAGDRDDDGTEDGDQDGDEPAQEDLDVRSVRDEESSNVIDAIGNGAMAGGRIAITVGALLIAFVALIALANGIVGAIGGLFGAGDLSFQQLLGYAFAPLSWLIGVPWADAVQAGQYIGEKTVLNEFVAFADFGPDVASLEPVTVAVVTFALAGFANFASIAIQIGTLGSLRPELRPLVARLGLRALLAGSLANLANAAVAGLVFAR